MIIKAETPEEERLLNRIGLISDHMAVQNNRATNMPMWTIVDGKRGDYGAVMFFTDYAAERHLITDSHHYDHPKTYVRSAHNNPELKDVVHLLLLVGGNKINDNHYGRLR
jgi:hypothetical protein